MRNRSLLLLGLVLSLASPAAAPAAARVALLQPVEDVSLPFWCDWGYAWDERCYHDDTARLAIGGDADKVWRAALRFSLAGIPAGSGVLEARLGLWYDKTCVGIRGARRACDGRSWTVEAHAILDPDWRHEREVLFDSSVAGAAVLPPRADARWLVLDVSELVAAWASGDALNAGILLKLADAQEDFLGSGPALPSAGFAVPSLRPWLEVTYVEPGGP
jgi:hypothetical protein